MSWLYRPGKAVICSVTARVWRKLRRGLLRHTRAECPAWGGLTLQAIFEPTDLLAQAHGWSEVVSFVTAPLSGPDSTVSFLAMADMGQVSSLLSLSSHVLPMLTDA